MLKGIFGDGYRPKVFEDGIQSVVVDAVVVVVVVVSNGIVVFVAAVVVDTDMV
jgi:hypothetical protein